MAMGMTMWHHVYFFDRHPCLEHWQSVLCYMQVCNAQPVGLAFAKAKHTQGREEFVALVDSHILTRPKLLTSSASSSRGNTAWKAAVHSLRSGAI
jgi:hypothetical protein